MIPVIAEIKSLNEMAMGNFAYVVDLRDNRICEELFELGFFPGEKVTILENDFHKNTLQIQFGNKIVPIFRKAASTILMSKVSFEFCLN